MQALERALVSKTQFPSQGPPRPGRETSIPCNAFSPEVDTQVSWHLQKEGTDFDGEVRDDLAGGRETF